MGFTMFATLVVENSKCREEWVNIVAPLILWGASAGGLGSLVCFSLSSDISRQLSFVVCSLIRSWGQRYNGHATLQIQSVFCRTTVGNQLVLT